MWISAIPIQAANVGTNGGAAAESQWPPASEGGAAANPRGEKALTLSQNDWLQDLDVGQDLADDLLADMAKPRPLVRSVSIVADPSIQLGDKVTLVDPNVSRMASEDAMVFAIQLKISRSDWTQLLDLRMVAPPGGWIMGKPGRSEMGVSTYV